MDYSLVMANPVHPPIRATAFAQNPRGAATLLYVDHWVYQ